MIMENCATELEPSQLRCGSKKRQRTEGTPPALSFRKSCGLWLEEEGLIEVVLQLGGGHLWATTGFSRSKKTYLFTEEAVYLADTGQLLLFKPAQVAGSGGDTPDTDDKINYARDTNADADQVPIEEDDEVCVATETDDKPRNRFNNDARASSRCINEIELDTSESPKASHPVGAPECVQVALAEDSMNGRDDDTTTVAHQAATSNLALSATGTDAEQTRTPATVLRVGEHVVVPLSNPWSLLYHSSDSVPMEVYAVYRYLKSRDFAVRRFCAAECKQRGWIPNDFEASIVVPIDCESRGVASSQTSRPLQMVVSSKDAGEGSALFPIAFSVFPLATFKKKDPPAPLYFVSVCRTRDRLPSIMALSETAQLVRPVQYCLAVVDVDSSVLLYHINCWDNTRGEVGTSGNP